MADRKDILAEGQIHHVFTRSIAGFNIFNTDDDYCRMIKTLAFYMVSNPPCRFSWFDESDTQRKKPGLSQDDDHLVNIFAYCIMPTHIHLVLIGLKENGVSKFMNLVLKSYSKYFNVKHKRQGPLWAGRFKNVAVDTDEQLLHLTRYIHLNPVTAHIVDKPEDWKFSSYHEYVRELSSADKICVYQQYLDCGQAAYRKFVDEQIDIQRELAWIKHLVFD